MNDICSEILHLELKSLFSSPLTSWPLQRCIMFAPGDWAANQNDWFPTCYERIKNVWFLFLFQPYYLSIVNLKAWNYSEHSY